MPRALAIAAVCLLVAQVAHAQDDQAYIDYRQKVMDSIGANMGAISDILKYDLPLEANIAGHATNIRTHATQILAAFEHRVTEGPTDALPAIWDDPEGFREAIEKFGAEAGKLAEIAGSGDRDAIGAQVRNLGGACGGCHKTYRKPKEESYKRR